MAENINKEKIVIDFETNANQTKGQIDNLNASVETSIEATEQNANAQKSFKAQLREANAELQKTIQIHGETSKEAIKAAKSVAELKDQMGFAKDLADSFNPDQKFKSLGAATQIAGTGLQGLTAGMALFGDQTEDTQKALLQVQSAMAFSDAISNLSNLGDQWDLLKSTIKTSTVSTKANTAATGLATMAQKLFTGSVDNTSKVFKALKVSIAATGIGLLVTGLAMVVANFDKITSVVGSVFPGLKKVGESIMGIVNAVTDFIGITSEAERKANAFEERASKNAEERLKNIKKQQALRTKDLNEHQQKLEDLLVEHLERLVNKEMSFNDSIKILRAQQRKENIRYQKEIAEERQKAIDEAEKNAKDKKDKADAQEKADLEKLLNDKKTLEERYLKDIQDLRDKTDEEKLARQKARDMNEIDLLAKKGIDITNLIISLDEKYSILEKDLANKKAEEKQKAEDEVREKEAVTEEEKLNLKYQKESKELDDLEKMGANVNELRIRLEDDYFNELNDIWDKEYEKEQEIEQRKKDLKIKAVKSDIELADSGIQATKDIAGKNKTIQKGIIVAESASAGAKVAMNTIEAVSKDVATSPLTFGAPWSIIHAAQGVAQGIGIVQSANKALQALGGGSVSSSPSVTAPTQGVSTSPTVGFQASNENQIATSINNSQKEQPVIKAYVVASDVTTQQNLDNKIISQNSI